MDASTRAFPPHAAECSAVKLGISDGVNVEVLKGVSEEDQVKVWNRTEERDEDNENDQDDA